MSGFIEYGDAIVQFDNGEPIPVTNLEITLAKTEGDGAEPQPVRLSDFEVTIQLPLEAGIPICNAVGLPEMADRIEFQTHPDLAELNVQMDGYYGGPEG